MPVPSAWTDISETAASNSPAGSESVGPNMNAYFQAAFAYCRQLYDGQINPLNPLNFNGQKITNVAAGVAVSDAVVVSQLGSYLALTGGALAGNVTSTGTLTITNNSNSALTVVAPSSASGANICLSDILTSTKKYIRCTNNNFQIINNAYNNTPFSMDDVGNLVMQGNITSSSDGRFKQHWAPLVPEFVDKLAKVKSGTYTNKRSKERQVGVTAQSLKRILPEAVMADVDSGYMSVAYGQAALVAAVELAKEVVALRKRIAKLEKNL